MSLKNSPTLKSSKIRVGLTIGDPAGIGPAITLAALKILKNKADFTVIGDSGVLAKTAKLLKITQAPVKLIDLNNVQGKKFYFGSLNAQNGKASLEYLDAAWGLLKKNKIDCLVTCPISKEAINLAGSKFSGHTEYLKERTKSKDIVMLLLNDKLRISLVTRHIPLKEVSGSLNQQVIVKNIFLTHRSLKSMFGIKNPRLVACGVNPHASDNGILGDEENKIIIPALRKVRDAGVSIDGPLSADVAIAQAGDGRYDCVIAMYHDQALIPLKLTGKSSGINMTLGLPFIRTSPLHGTAFDIARIPHLADPASLIAAIKLAVKCASRLKINL